MVLDSLSNVNLVLSLSERIEKRTLKEELPPGISRRELLLKIVYDELTDLLGGEKVPQVLPSSKEPYVIMLVGIQGSGKTTSAGKLAAYFKRKGLKTGLVCADNFRPGALAQLKQLGAPVDVPVFGRIDVDDAINQTNNRIDVSQVEQLVASCLSQTAKDGIIIAAEVQKLYNYII